MFVTLGQQLAHLLNDIWQYLARLPLYQVVRYALVSQGRRLSVDLDDLHTGLAPASASGHGRQGGAPGEMDGVAVAGHSRYSAGNPVGK